jgi:hypothetical protein
MKVLAFDVGDKVWAHGAKPQTFRLKLWPWPKMVADYRYQGEAKLSEGKVVLEFQKYETKYYVVEFQSSVEPILMVYTGWTLSDSPNKPIGIWRR